MLLQTNSYIVPREKRMEHARLLRKFRQTLIRLGCDHFEVYEQVGANWNSQDSTGRFVQIMRFRDRRHQLEVQAAERSDPSAQTLIQEFCNLINFPYQQQEGLFAVGYYVGFMRMPPTPAPQIANPTTEGEPAVPAEEPTVEEPSTAIPESEVSPVETAVAESPIEDPQAEEQTPIHTETIVAEESANSDESIESTEQTGDATSPQLEVIGATMDSLTHPISDSGPESTDSIESTNEEFQPFDEEEADALAGGNGQHDPLNATGIAAQAQTDDIDIGAALLNADLGEDLASAPESSNGEHDATEAHPPESSNGETTTDQTTAEAHPTELDDIFNLQTPTNESESLPSDDEVFPSRH